MFMVLTAGLPISAKDILSNAMNEVFDGAVDMQELTDDNLRRFVRLSGKSTEIVLVVLDSVSSDLCSDIENGLYSSDKYYTYTTDLELANFLNNKYNLSIVVEEVEMGVTKEDVFIEDNYAFSELLDKIKVKDDIIFNLETQIKDILAFYLEEGETAISDSSELLDIKSQLGISEGRVVELEKTISAKDTEIEGITKKLNKLSSQYESISAELRDLKVVYSKQTGVLHDKESKVEELKGIIDSLKSDSAKVEELNTKILSLKTMVADKDRVIADLNVDLASKTKEIQGYITELESLRNLSGVNDELKLANDTIKSLREELSSVSSENTELRKRVNSLDKDLTVAKNDIKSKEDSIENFKLKNEELSERVKSDNESLSRLNIEKLELQSKLSLLEESGNSEDFTDNLINEIQDLRTRLASISSSIFTRIGLSALPNSPVGCRVLNTKFSFNNIRFVFSGSSESRKGTYKCLLDEFRSSKDNTNYLIVDLVSETAVDYVFEVKKLVPGIEWFRKGGSVHRFLSSTALKNTKVLSTGLGYINDSYFLSIDWAKRLYELENSGFKVILFCGDISNLIGRVLHESFASCGESEIYVLGNSTGSRSIITNLRGLSNAKDSLVIYYDFNYAMNKFYDIVAKTNDCKILNERNMGRR